MSNIRETFIIYKDWDNAIRKAPVEMQAELYHALIDFVSTGEKPQGLSWQAEMLMSAIEKQIEKTLERYRTSVENGKQGGRKKETDNTPDVKIEESEKPSTTLEEPNVTQKEPDENLEKPNTTKSKPNQNLNDYDYVNDYVNVFSQSNNNRAREIKAKTKDERDFWRKKFNDFWTFGITAERDKLGFEVIDVIIEACEQAKNEKKLVYNLAKYDYIQLFELMDKLDDEDLSKIVWSLQNQQEIKNRPYYILGALINKAKEKSPPSNLSKLDKALLNKIKGEKA